MASFFRRSVARKLARVLGHAEELFIPLLSALPVSKKQCDAGLRVSAAALQKAGLLVGDEDAQKLVDQVELDSEVEQVSADRGGLVFRLSRRGVAEALLAELRAEPEGFGLKSDLLRGVAGGRALVEFSSPNIAKKFHAGHLRSTIIGHFIANLKEALGQEVVRVNYLGDWGMQFGLLGVGFERWGSAELLRARPLEHLFQLYVRVNSEAVCDEGLRADGAEFFRRLERREGRALELWSKLRLITVEEYQRVYQRLGVHFHHYSGESLHQTQTQTLLEDLRRRRLLSTTRKGTGVVDLSQAGDMSSYATLVRSDGTSLYITRDVAAAVDRKRRFDFDEMIYVTDKSQSAHFLQLFRILSLMGHSWAEKCVHVAFGRVRGMSTRSGDVVFLEDVLNEARHRMLQNIKRSQTSKAVEDVEETAETLGISAVIVQDFRGPLMDDYSFDWERVLQAEGDTGVFLQYTHARLCSLLQRHEGVSHTFCDVTPLLENRSFLILQHLLRFDEVLLQSSRELQPRHLLNFLFRLCHLTSSAHRELPVRGSLTHVAQARLCLFHASRCVLALGMKILGLKPVQKM